jgi:hypothetical protein
LQYDDVDYNFIEPDLGKALQLVATASMADTKVVFATYTAMLHLHARLQKEAGKTL